MRHRSQHVHKTMCDLVTHTLTQGGWLATPAPYGATPVTVVEVEPQRAGTAIKSNTVAITIDAKTPELGAEMGYSTGEMKTTSWHLFVDVYGESDSICKALCDDIVTGLSDLYVPVADYTSHRGPPTPTTTTRLGAALVGQAGAVQSCRAR
jgi:hypothetical protein